MKSIARGFMLAALLVAGLVIAGHAAADDQIRWATDYRAACQLAADQHRLVLLHFYNDNCEPCVRLERNVFSQGQVGEAVATNFIPVKVHAGKESQLANRYRVRSWPTDVFVTPSGLEVYRSISPQKPDEYIALVNQVAQQTGVSASRNWSSKLGTAVATAGAAGDAGNPSNSTVRQATEQAAVTAPENATEGQQRWSAALEQFKAASDQARATTADTAQQADRRWRQTQDQATVAGQQWSQQTTDAVNRYEQQAGESYRQFREQATEASQSVQQQAQQIQKDAESTVQQVANTARSSTSRWQQTFSQATADAAAAANTAVAAATGVPSVDKPADKPAAAASPAPPLIPSENPWIAMKQQEALATATAAEPQPSAPAASTAPPLVPQIATPQAAPAAPAVATTPAAPPPTTPPAPATTPYAARPFASAPAAAVAAAPRASEPPPTQPFAATPPQRPAPTFAPPTSSAPGQLIPASQAPTIAMDGFCPVSLLDTVSRDPHDRAAWKKGNPKFGAIHRGRTYLFVSPEHQQRFLANPDAFAPVLSGRDPVVFAERGELLDGKRAYGLITPDKRVYLFADESALRKFNQNPASYAAAAQQAMLRSDGGSMYR